MSEDKLKAYRTQIGCSIESLFQEIKETVNITTKGVEIWYRVKDPRTLTKKMKLKEVSSVFDINDIYGIRILVNSIDETYAALEEIKTRFPGYLDHDYISQPKVRDKSLGPGLRLLQYVAYRNEIPFEIQITTRAFNKVNESYHQAYHHRRYGSD